MKNLIVSALGLVFVTSAAHATIVTVDMFGHTAANGHEGFLINYSGAHFVTATPFNAEIDDNPGVFYCVDLDHAAAVNSTYHAETLSALALLGAVGGRLGYIYNTYALPAPDTDHKIAAQVAMWEVRYDASYNLDAGTFSVQASLNAGVKALAQTILNDLAANPAHITDVTIYRKVANEGLAQDILGPAPVPEPASLAALGLGAIGFLRRRRQK